jgi:ankyrin repeat protein
MGRTTRRKKNRRKVLRGGGPNEDLFEAVADGNLAGVKAALDTGANIEARNGLTATPVMMAIMNTKFDIARELLARGADINAALADEGTTALMLAAGMDDVDAVNFLLDKGADRDKKDNKGYKAISHAISQKIRDLIAVVRKNKGLFIAAKDGNLAGVKAALDAGANIDEVGEDGQTSLYIASFFNRIDVVKELLDRGANIEAESNGETSLHIASNQGCITIVRLLLARGANIDAETSDGMTSLWIAIEAGELDVVRLLLARGANIEKIDHNGNTPLLFASYVGDFRLVNLLLEKGADRNRKNRDGKTAYEIAKTEQIRVLLRPIPPVAIEETTIPFANQKVYDFIEVEDVPIETLMGKTDTLIFKIGNGYFSFPKSQIVSNYSDGSSVRYKCKREGFPTSETVVLTEPYYYLQGTSNALVSLDVLKSAINKYGALELVDTGEMVDILASANSITMLDTGLDPYGRQPNIVSADHCQTGTAQKVYSVKGLIIQGVPAIPTVSAGKRNKNTRRKTRKQKRKTGKRKTRK